MWEYNNLDELYHYGVLGMKWGRRRRQQKAANIEKTRKSTIEEVKRSKYGKTSTHLYGQAAAKTAIGGVMTSVGSKLALKGKAKTGTILAGMGTLYSVSGLIDMGRSFVNNKTAANKAYKAETKKMKKEYGKLEDQYTYGKNADLRKNAILDKKLSALEQKISNR